MNNQTIDGVPRELLERAAKAIEKHHGSLQWVIASELRALLDAPDTVSGKLPPVGRQAMWQAIDEALTGTVEPMLRGDICNILASLLVPAAQPQGEPVACFEKFARDRCPGVYFGKDANGEYMAADARLVLDFWNAGFRAEQPAPVAVVRKLEMVHVVRAHMEITGCPVLTSNQCHALAMKLNESLKPSL